MQLLATPVDAVAAYDRVHARAVGCVEIIAKCAKIVVRFAHVLHLARDELDDDDVVEIANNGNIVPGTGGVVPTVEVKVTEDEERAVMNRIGTSLNGAIRRLISFS